MIKSNLVVGYKLIKKGQRRGQKVIIRPLSSAEKWLLNNNKHQSIDDNTAMRTQRILKMFKEQQYWLTCECNDEAVLYLRQHESGQISLIARSDSQYQAHSKDCLYRRTSDRGGNPNVLAKAKREFNFIRNTASHLQTKQSATSPSSSGGGNVQSTLFNLMVILQVDAGLDVIPKGTMPLQSTSRASILSSASKLMLAGVKMSSCIFFYPQWKAMASALKSLPFSKKCNPHVLTWWVISNYRQRNDGDWEVYVKCTPSKNSERWVHLRGTRLSFKHTLGTPGWSLLVMIYATKADGTGNYCPRGFVAPIVSDNNWLIVDSDNERKVAMAAINAMQNSSLDSLKLQKPLVDRLESLNGNDALVRPDFIIKRGGKEAVVEVMGFNSDEYKARKSSLKPFMASIGSYFEIDATRTFPSIRKREQYFYAVCRDSIAQLS